MPAVSCPTAFIVVAAAERRRRRRRRRGIRDFNNAAADDDDDTDSGVDSDNIATRTRAFTRVRVFVRCVNHHTHTHAHARTVCTCGLQHRFCLILLCGNRRQRLVHPNAIVSRFAGAKTTLIMLLANLRKLRSSASTIRPITSKTYHPQTLGSDLFAAARILRKRDNYLETVALLRLH